MLFSNHSYSLFLLSPNVSGPVFDVEDKLMTKIFSLPSGVQTQISFTIYVRVLDLTLSPDTVE